MRQRISTAEFVRNYGTLADAAIHEPITITSHGRDRLVLLSSIEYERLLQQDRQAMKTADAPDWINDAVQNAQIPAQNAKFDNEIE